MKTRFTLLLTPFLALFAIAGCTKSANKTGEEPAKRVFFISPKDGDSVPGTFTVKFGVEGYKIRPAGEDVMEKTSGHHHLLIDDPQGYIETGMVSPADATHIHYGKGETEATITLTPGKHKLSLQFANGAHLSYGKEMSASITVNVQGAGTETAPPAKP